MWIFSFIAVFLSLIFTIVIFFVSRDSNTKKAVKIIWFGAIGLIITLIILNMFVSKIIIEKNDFYGEYIVDRDFFSGEDADWQYNTYRFEIKQNDSLYFHVTDKEKIIKTYIGNAEAVNLNNSARLRIIMKTPYHVLNSNPTIYRESWGFYLVFYSPFYNNMYFRKGEWESID